MPYFSHQQQQLHYREAGDGKRALLILPGNTASSEAHQHDLEYYGKYCHAISFDYPGTGNSERLKLWTTDWWQLCADAAAALLEHLDIEKCAVVGTSGGAAVAMYLASEYPDRVSCIVADSIVPRWSREAIMAELVARENPSTELIGFWQIAHGDDWRDVIEADSEMMRELAEEGGELIGNTTMAQVNVPVLLTASLEDESLPNVAEQQLKMLSSLPDAELHMYKEGKHPIMWTRADEFRELSRSFVRKALGV